MDDNNTQQQQGTKRREHCSSSSSFDFVCSSCGTTAEEGGEEVGFDRVCALRGEVVHIFTFFHAGAEEDGGSSSGQGEGRFIQQLFFFQKKQNPSVDHAT